MKTALILLQFMLCGMINCMAQNDVLTWLVSGKQSGEDILYRPNQYIGNEKNYDRLIIKTREGNEIVSPADGYICMFNYAYWGSLTNIMVWGISDINDQTNRMDIASTDNLIDPKYVSVNIGIKTDNNGVIYISGLRPIKMFKTGERIKAGDIIGKSGYCYSKIPESSVSVSISKNGVTSDPMSPFGLKSSFIKPTAFKQKSILTPDEMKEDLNIMINALEEGHPGLYDYMPESEFRSLTDDVRRQINRDLSFNSFYDLLQSISIAIRDSHTRIMAQDIRAMANPSKYLHAVEFGWINDSLIVTRSTMPYIDFNGKRIDKIDGLSADSLKRFIVEYLGTEGHIESSIDFALATYAFITYFDSHPNASTNKDLLIEFTDGSKELFKGFTNRRNQCNLYYPSTSDMRKYYFFPDIKTNFLGKKDSDSVAYLLLKTFELNDVEMTNIERFIDTISKDSSKYLIIDLRNNFGGSAVNLERIYSMIAQKPFKTELFEMVNKKGTYNFFNYTNNLNGVTNMFENYKPIAGRQGFYLQNDDVYYPNDSISFKGKIYVLTNEKSISAASLFAALVHKQRRGVIVGRETGTAYYQMNALKFADLTLPNSGIEVRMPLVKIVFDTISNPLISWGRGVLPDYPVTITMDEISWKNGDSILKYTYSLIHGGKYLPPVTNIDDKSSDELNSNLSIIVAAIIALAITLIIVKRNKNRRKI